MILLDSTLDGTLPRTFGAAPTNWISELRGSARPQPDITPDDARIVAKACRDGRGLIWPRWGGSYEIKMHADAFTILDFEAMWRRQYIQRICDYIKAFRDMAPGIRLGIYTAIPMYPDAAWAILGNDKFVAAARNPYAWPDLHLAESIKAAEPIMRLVDALCPDFYVWKWPIDSGYIDAMCDGAAGCDYLRPIIPFVRGSFAWNWTQAAGGTALPADVLDQYAAKLRQRCSAVIVWGLRSENLELARRLVG